MRRTAALLVLVGCHAKAAPTEDAGREVVTASTGYGSGPSRALRAVKSQTLTFMGHGSWAALAPGGGERAIVGSPGQAMTWPDNKVLAVKNPTAAAFAPDGKHVLVASSSGVTIVDANDLATVGAFPDALDAKWIGSDEIAFQRAGQVYRGAIGADARMVGPPKPVSTATKATFIADNAARWLLVDANNYGRATRIHRIDLTEGRDVTLIAPEVSALFVGGHSFAAEPAFAVAPDLSRACLMGHAHDRTAIWCGTGEGPAEEIATLSDNGNNFTLRFLTPTKLAFDRHVAGSVSIADFESRTVATLSIPNATRPIDLVALPGAKLAVARDPLRMGVVDLAGGTFAPLGTSDATPTAVVGLAPDDASFALSATSLQNGIGSVYRARPRE